MTRMLVEPKPETGRSGFLDPVVWTWILIHKNEPTRTISDAVIDLSNHGIRSLYSSWVDPKTEDYYSGIKIGFEDYEDALLVLLAGDHID